MCVFFRFKDNNIIDKDLYYYNKTLEISDVAGLNGSFRCRVVNQFGSEFSNGADLKVLGKNSLLITKQNVKKKKLQLWTSVSAEACIQICIYVKYIEYY